MKPEALMQRLKSTKAYLDQSTSDLTEQNSSFRPTEDSLTVAQQFAHVALVIDWFVEGGFGDGFGENDYAKMPTFDDALENIKSLAGARSLCAQSFSNAIRVVGSKTPQQVSELMPENSIMGAAPRMNIVHAIEDHTVHHCGVLNVYSRMCGIAPPMSHLETEVAV